MNNEKLQKEWCEEWERTRHVSPGPSGSSALLRRVFRHPLVLVSGLRSSGRRP